MSGTIEEKRSLIKTAAQECKIASLGKGNKQLVKNYLIEIKRLTKELKVLTNLRKRKKLIRDQTYP